MRTIAFTVPDLQNKWIGPLLGGRIVLAYERSGYAEYTLFPSLLRQIDSYCSWHYPYSRDIDRIPTSFARPMDVDP